MTSPHLIAVSRTRALLAALALLAAPQPASPEERDRPQRHLAAPSADAGRSPGRGAIRLRVVFRSRHTHRPGAASQRGVEGPAIARAFATLAGVELCPCPPEQGDDPGATPVALALPPRVLDARRGTVLLGDAPVPGGLYCAARVALGPAGPRARGVAEARMLGLTLAIEGNTFDEGLGLRPFVVYSTTRSGVDVPMDPLRIRRGRRAQLTLTVDAAAWLAGVDVESPEAPEQAMARLASTLRLSPR